MFKAPKFDKDNVGDEACKNLLAQSSFGNNQRRKAKKAQQTEKKKESIKVKTKNIIENKNAQAKEGPPRKPNKNPKLNRSGVKSMQSSHVKDNGKPTDNAEKVIRVKKTTRLKKRKQKANEEQDLKFFNPIFKRNKRNLPLRERMMEQLKAARFRYLNEQLYSTTSHEAQSLFDEDTFKAYHEGYRQQVKKWPMNPLNLIVKDLKKLSGKLVVADFGCGDAKLAESVKQKVHSFDLVAMNDRVVACDMAHVPLEDASVDIVVFCLSLMGTNLQDYLSEANRVLKTGGLLKIAEVESRFSDVNEFISNLKRFNFKNIVKNLSHALFFFLDFRKEANVQLKKNLPAVSLNPCLYKKR